MSSDAVKIYFCDICNESIPVKDLETGTAITIKGKAICHRCNPQNTPRPAAAVPTVSAHPAVTGHTVTPVYHTAHGSFGLAGAIGLIALLLAGATITLVLVEREKTQQNFLKTQESSQAGEQLLVGKFEKQVNEQLNAIKNELEKRERKLSEEVQNQVEKDRLSAENRLAGINEKLSVLQETLRQTESLRSKMEQGDAWRAAADQKLAALKADMENFSREILSVREAASKAAAATPAAGTPPAAGNPVPGWEDMVKRLKDPDPGVRWKAVSEFGEAGDPRAVSHLIPLLKDEDIFVRNNVARTLGELDAKGAVGELIDALADNEPTVRDSIYTALKRITKQNIKFDPFATRKDEREKAVTAWKDWWNANKAKLSGS